LNEATTAFTTANDAFVAQEKLQKEEQRKIAEAARAKIRTEFTTA
jgi:hypothetical protein